MKLTRYSQGGNPVEQWSSIRNEISRLFDIPFSDFSPSSQFFDEGWVPALDLYEDREDLVVKAELPGLSKDEIDISLHEGTLAISGERKAETKDETNGSYRSERFFGRFQRTLTLPKAVDAGKVQATYKDGVLTVTLPKTEEAKPRQIQVNVN